MSGRLDGWTVGVGRANPLDARNHMHDWRSILKSEFDAEDGSFPIQLRCSNRWDKDAFNRLAAAMKSCCIESCDDESLERWIADGFWDTESLARDWVANPSSSLVHSAEYYNAATELLHQLAYWYFRGESPAGPDADPDLMSLSLPD